MRAQYKKLILILFVLYFSACRTQLIEKQATTYVDITPVQAKEKIDRGGDILILDVRTGEEFSEGHIKGAVNVPVQELEKRLDELKRYKNFEIIVYCRSGNRSKRASEILVKNGFKHVYNLSGGIIEWKKQFGDITK